MIPFTQQRTLIVKGSESNAVAKTNRMVAEAHQNGVEMRVTHSKVEYRDTTNVFVSIRYYKKDAEMVRLYLNRWYCEVTSNPPFPSGTLIFVGDEVDVR